MSHQSVCVIHLFLSYILNSFSNNLVVCTTAPASGLSSHGVNCISSERGHHQASGGCDNTAVTDTSHVFKVSYLIFPMDDVQILLCRLHALNTDPLRQRPVTSPISSSAAALRMPSIASDPRVKPETSSSTGRRATPGGQSGWSLSAPTDAVS